MNPVSTVYDWGKTWVRTGVEESMRTAVDTAVPKLATGAKTITSVLGEMSKRNHESKHARSEANASNTVEEEEFDYAKNWVKTFWSNNPFRVLQRWFRWIAPGFDNESSHIEVLNTMTKYASQFKSNFFANDASQFLLEKIKTLTTGGIFFKLFTSDKELMSNKLLNSYVDAAAKWMQALDNKSDKDLRVISQLSSLVKYSGLPEFIVNKLAPILDRKQSPQEPQRAR